MNHLRPIVLLLLAGCSRLQAPLRVGPRGVLLRDGKPFHAIGVNYFDCFARTLRDPSDRSYEEGFAELAEMADRTGIARGKVIKHFSPPLVAEDENHGIFPSVLSTEKAIKKAISKGTRFLMETDYIDDPRRPGAVLGLKTVPKRVKKFLAEGWMSEEDVYVIHKDNPEQVYGISMD